MFSAMKTKSVVGGLAVLGWQASALRLKPMGTPIGSEDELQKKTKYGADPDNDFSKIKGNKMPSFRMINEAHANGQSAKSNVDESKSAPDVLLYSNTYKIVNTFRHLFIRECEENETANNCDLNTLKERLIKALDCSATKGNVLPEFEKFVKTLEADEGMFDLLSVKLLEERELLKSKATAGQLYQLDANLKVWLASKKTWFGIETI